MVDQLALQTIGILMTGISMTIAAVYYTLTLRNTQKTQQLQLETRKAQLFMQIYNRITDKAFMKKFIDIIFHWEWTDYDDFMEKYGPENNIDAFADWTSVGLYIDGLGSQVKRGLIDVGQVDDLISGVIIRYWEKREQFTRELRERMNYPQYGEYVEYLYNQIKPIIEEQHPELKA
jgi:hypothetical protein